MVLGGRVYLFVVLLTPHKDTQERGLLELLQKVTRTMGLEVLEMMQRILKGINFTVV